MSPIPFALGQKLALSFHSSCSVPASPYVFPPPIHHVNFRSSVRCAFSSALQANRISKFEQASKRGNLVPLYHCLFEDQLTPVLAYRALVKENDRDVPSFLFESVQPPLGNPTMGRYSIVGAYPSMEIIATGNFVTVLDHLDGRRTEEFVQDPIVVPKRILQKWTPLHHDHLPQVFSGGWIGYFGHEHDSFLGTRRMLPTLGAPVNDRQFANGLPDMHLGLYDDVILFDHAEKRIYAIHWVQLDRFSSEEEALDDGMYRLNTLLSKIRDVKITLVPGPTMEISSRITSEVYKNGITESKQQIVDVNLSQIASSKRIERRTFANPFEVYRAFRIVSSNPFTTYLQARGCIVVASGQQKLPSSHKVKDMELTDKLETFKRGRYGGGFGSISFSGDMDITALACQSIIFPTDAIYDTIYSYNYKNHSKRREWVGHLQADSTVMWGNQPRDMDRKSKDKVIRLAKAFNLAESSFIEKN